MCGLPDVWIIHLSNQPLWNSLAGLIWIEGKAYFSTNCTFILFLSIVSLSVFRAIKIINIKKQERKTWREYMCESRNDNYSLSLIFNPLAAYG